MFTVIADGDGRYRLEDARGAQVGWIRGRAIGFQGMRSEAAAISAVGAAWNPLQASLRRQYAGRPRDEAALDRLRLAHDGAYEWVTDGRVPLARLHRPAADRAAATFAVELVLPSYTSEGAAIAVAQFVGSALSAHLGGGGGDAGREWRAPTLPAA
jgi:hypothetical protein